MPNVQNILALRDAIMAAPEHFDMKHWARGPYYPRDGDILPQHILDHTPDYTACFGGWAEALFGDQVEPLSSLDENAKTVDERCRIVAEYLGITEEQANDLFLPGSRESLVDVCETSPYWITAAQGARVLDHLAETGEVDWSVA
jgi:hypothetical protein